MRIIQPNQFSNSTSIPKHSPITSYPVYHISSKTEFHRHVHIFFQDLTGSGTRIHVSRCDTSNEEFKEYNPLIKCQRRGEFDQLEQLGYTTRISI
mmetsp:Transcript_26269/g.30998  ORF Transcript_26269/g.30998 Transcript_26269/m.30998 type:complete len:95 (+) Transcript_26269:339-623(+)